MRPGPRYFDRFAYPYLPTQPPTPLPLPLLREILANIGKNGGVLEKSYIPLKIHWIAMFLSITNK